jgi:predicted DsbA family dithiol-disulfide isomerase
MIFSYQVKWIAEKHLREVLKEYPTMLDIVLEPRRFETWCRLCAERLTQLDAANFVRTKYAMDEFVKSAACVYADIQLKRVPC